MKTLRILLTISIAISVFLSAGAVPAMAARGEEVGYVGLLSDESLSDLDLRQGMDVGVARAMITAHAGKVFDRMLPKLLDAQRSGAILDFRPELAFGIVQIKYPVGANLANVVPGFQVYSEAKEAIVKAKIRQGVEFDNVLTYNPRFWNVINSSCYSVYGLLSGYRVVTTLKNAAGKTLAVSHGYADSYGEVRNCFNFTAPGGVRPGFKIIYKIYTPTGVLRNTYSQLVPKGISITGYNKIASQMSFTGPPGKKYFAVWLHDKLDKNNSNIFVPINGTFPTSGNVTADMGTVRFRGGDLLYVDVEIGRFEFNRQMLVPHIVCYVGDNVCHIRSFPFQNVFITLQQDGKSYTVSGRSGYSGYFWGDFTDAAGNPIGVKNRAKVSGTNVAQYTLPNLTASIAYATDVVKGKAPKSRYFELWVYRMVTSSWYFKWAHSNSLGNYSKDFTSMVNLKANEPYYVEIYFMDKITGNVTDEYFPFAP